MIEVKNLVKSYKLSKKKMQKAKTKEKIVVAVNGVSFVAKPGEIFGLLGPNGAGKTTTLRCVSTLLKPTGGEISVMGKDVESDSEGVRKHIAFLTNELKLDKHFTPDYTVDFFARLYNMDRESINKRKEELFEYFGITNYRQKKIGELSTGMMQKLSIVVSLIHDPDVVIFDEPTNGLDIVTAKKVTEYLRELRNQGKVVVISTHIMDLAEKLCDRIAIMLDGEIKIHGTLQQILEETGEKDLEEAFFKVYKDLNPEM